MHELSVALAIIDAVEEKARELGARQVRAVYLRVGALSGVDADALRFSFDVAARDTDLENARLELSREDVAVWCEHCAAERAVIDLSHRRCSVCGELAPRVVAGDTLELTAIEVG